MADEHDNERELVATYLTLLSETELAQLLSEVELRRPQAETSYTWGDMDTDIPTTHTDTN